MRAVLSKLKKKKNEKEILSSIEEAIKDIKSGRMLIVTDSEDRENEGDLVMSAQDATPEKINFMASHGRGLICAPITSERAAQLELGPMVKENQDVHRTAFTISVDAKHNIKTGISASDRSKTIKQLSDFKTNSEDFVKPGHVFPLVAKDGGVLVRAGHTEACIDLMNLAGKKPAGVICEIMNSDGTMARMKDLIKFAQKHNLKIVTIKDLIAYRRKREKNVNFEAEAKIPTKYGVFNVKAFKCSLDKKVHMALSMGSWNEQEPILVRVHSECLTGDVFNSQRCDCGEQLEAAMKLIADQKKGVILYMRQEGRGIGIVNKLKAYHMQDEGLDTVEANEKLGFPPDLRDYGIGAQILVKLGLKKIRLLTNNPRKIVGLDAYNLEVVERVPLVIKPNKYNQKYLDTKFSKLGHLLKD
ncbi:MAG: bifunctional 3,4-dihydroxy-2-butanone-4-phosphate synthase/GTP cyclohydrolase II [Spirochaetia bacterium]|nr:bifunctional 3,4-dihydroxy-2-butanone-4-phosphate synthase/GTP cyclohydrolase II [Spirochaetia bacterium]